MEITKVLEAVKKLGFTVTEVEGQGHMFTYRDLNMYFLSDERDEGRIRISLPMLWQQYQPSQVPVILDMLNVLNSRNENTKSYLRDDQVWCWFETRITDESILEKTIEQGLLSLIGTYEEFLEMLNGEFDPNDDCVDYIEDDVYGWLQEDQEFEAFLLGNYDDNFNKIRPSIESEQYPF